MLKMFVAVVALALPLATFADGETGDRLVEKYSRFAGSTTNAQSLVEGLRNDQPVQLSSKTASSASFAPATGKMGYGNVDISLNLAKASLAEHGIYSPNPEQIKAALNGGMITTKSGERVQLAGVLAQRASGMGWGEIAQSHGFKLGELMRHKPDRDHKRAERGADFQRARHERPDRPEKFEKPERPERPERGGRR